MKSIAYFLNVPWSWIKQRPQFIAEQLTREFDVHIYEELEFKKRTQKNKKKESMTFHKMFRLPLQRKLPILKLNHFFYKIQLKNKLCDYDIIWLTHPTQINYIDSKLSNAVIVYDCMDDMLLFPTVCDKYNYFHYSELTLINRADYIFFSSEYLKKKIEKRYKKDLNQKSYIVNNAINKSMLKMNYHNNSKKNKSEYKHIVYIGTIAEWIDFKLLYESLDIFPNIQYDFYGPFRTEVPYSHDRLVFHGTIEHDDVAKVLAAADLLIMPFLVTDLIKAVNPVKLYEYISSGVPSLAVRYGESEKFSEFVYLYGSKDEFYKYITNLVNHDLPVLKTLNERRNYLKENTWDKRGMDIVEKLYRLAK